MKPRWTFQAICHAIQAWHATYGKPPRKTDFDRDPSLPSATTVWRVYGSLTEAHFDALGALYPAQPRQRDGRALRGSCALHPLKDCRVPTPAQAANLVYVICSCGAYRVLSRHRWLKEGHQPPAAVPAPLHLEIETRPDEATPGDLGRV